LHNEENQLIQDLVEPTKEEPRLLHSLIKKVQEDIERLSFNTSIPAFMVFSNEMQRLTCRKKAIWEKAIVCLAPYAPHIAEELWAEYGNTESIFTASFPEFNAALLELDEINYPIQVNGKTSSFTLTYPAGLDKNALEEAVRADEKLGEILKGRELKKLIAVPGRIVNLVLEG
jgi:leucyl-tRNA synthetase